MALVNIAEVVSNLKAFVNFRLQAAAAHPRVGRGLENMQTVTRVVKYVTHGEVEDFVREINREVDRYSADVTASLVSARQVAGGVQLMVILAQ